MDGIVTETNSYAAKFIDVHNDEDSHMFSKGKMLTLMDFCVLAVQLHMGPCL
jgi:hypothetical protein